MPRLLLLFIVTLAAGALLAEALPSRPAHAGSSQLLEGVTALAIGNGQTCAVAEGSLKCWGSVDFPGIAQPECGTCLVPMAIPGREGISAVAMGIYESCYLANGSGVCWGNQSTNLRDFAGDIGRIDIGENGGCLTTLEGALKCWGTNNFGNVGDGTEEFRSTPVDVSGLSTGVAFASMGQVTSCAVLTTGGLKCWGDNTQGGVGDGTRTNRLTPVDVVGLTSGLLDVSVSAAACAVTGQGGVKCWGINTFGILGEGHPLGVTTPMDIRGLEQGVMAVSVSGGHACVLTISGGVKCWGRNADGELGDGTTTDRLTPVDVVGLQSGVAEVVAGDFQTCAITVGGTVKCWGSNRYGQLGDSTLVDRRVPVDVVAEAPLRPGDVDCDEMVTSKDAFAVLVHVAYPRTKPVCFRDGDLNKDGLLTSLDALIILQYSAGLIPSLPVTH